MVITLDDLRNHSTSKKLFANRLGITERKVQLMSDELYNYLISNGGEVTPQGYLDFARDETKMVHNYFNWTRSEEYNLALSQETIDLVDYLVLPDNRLAKLSKVEYDV